MKGLKRIARFLYRTNWCYFLKYKGRVRFSRCYTVSIAKTACLKVADTFCFRVHIPYFPQKRNFAELRLDEEAEFSICGDVMLAMVDIWVLKGGQLTMGNCFINHGTTILCKKQITIGDDVGMGRNVWITDSDGHPITGQEMSKPIVIGNHVWIGSQATILKGVTIGSGSIVAQGAVVTKDVPEGCVVAGVPARVVRENVEWSEY